MGGLTLRNLGLALAATLSPATALAQQAPDDRRDQTAPDQQADPNDYSDVVVTAMKVRQGGAQDASHFRDIAANVGLPHPESITAEGLLGDHDLTLPTGAACAKLFCLTTEAMPAALPTRSADRMFVGLGFTSNIDAATWHRAPLNLMAVIDKSGSMNGHPLAMVRASLRRLVGQMHDGDRIGIVLYGDTAAVYLAPTDLAGHRGDILKAIDHIASAGSTNMESGLKVGYDAAFADAPRFAGTTRVMLFTDEQPNVGNTDADSFMTMAEDASQRGIGLTTIGVGVQFDDTLASKIASVRGGNMFFIAQDEDVVATFDKRLDTMVSELAHDLHLTMTPAPGYRISGVFGVPDGAMMQAPEGAVTVTVPTVFLSTNGGGIYATMAKSSERADLPAATIAPGEPLMTVALDYHPAKGGSDGSDRVTVAAPSVAPSVALRQAGLLVDEYLVLRDATTAYHVNNDAKTAFAALNGFSARLQSSGLPGMQKERKLLGDMIGQAAYYAGFTGEMPRTLRHLGVVGKWRIVQASGFTDLHRGDTLEFTDERELLTSHASEAAEDEDEPYQINEREIRLVDSKLVMQYAVNGDRLSMSIRDPASSALLNLRRMD
jgi:Ca-activated chloride channel family protein